MTKVASGKILLWSSRSKTVLNRKSERDDLPLLENPHGCREAFRVPVLATDDVPRAVDVFLYNEDVMVPKRWEYGSSKNPWISA